jgi:cardiolipin synthase
MSEFHKNNHLRLLKNGADYFPALEQAIHRAQHEIYLQTYIFESDETGKRIAYALKQAAARGVAIYLLLDGLGSKSLSQRFIEDLRQSGIQLMFYRPVSRFNYFSKNRLRRQHRKVVVIDGRIGFVGGINIIDDFNVPDDASPRVDYAVEIQGNMLVPLTQSVHRLWRRLSWFQSRQIPKTFIQPITKLAPNLRTMKSALVLRDNVLHRRDIEQAYLNAINQAKQEIIIANAYFFPGWRVRNALMDASNRGVKVVLLLQGRIEYWIRVATHAFYGAFLRQGIEIHEYRRSFMHSKVAVIDSEWATVGSSNIDPFSLMLAREANVVVQDRQFATELRESLMQSIQEGAQQIHAPTWIRGNLRSRLMSWLVYGALRGLIGLFGYGKEWQG